ncbi:MAG: hypothetical protein ACYSU3_06960 [Planctomycetota bacterium]|jgi:hypothetical protein
MNLIDYIVNIFVMADDFCKIYFPARKLRSRGPLPKLADSEVIAMELVGEYLGLRTDESEVAAIRKLRDLTVTCQNDTQQKTTVDNSGMKNNVDVPEIALSA